MKAGKCVPTRDRLARVVEELAVAGLLRSVPASDAELLQQETTLKRLLTREAGDSASSYTTAYDSMMRIAEIATLRFGYALGLRMPHRALKDLQLGLRPESSIDQVVRVRHRVKKGGYVPTVAELARLQDERSALAKELGLLHLLEE